MSLPIIKTWQCDIYPHRLQLREGDLVLGEQIIGESPLEEALLTLLEACPTRFPWLDAIEFWLDVDKVYYLMLPWQEGIKKPEELRYYAQSLIPNTFPQLAKQELLIGFETAEYAKTALAVALEHTLWQTMKDVAKHKKLRFYGVITPLQPLLEYWGKNLPDQGIFAVMSADAVTFASRNEGNWDNVHRMALPDLPTSEQLALVRRLSGSMEIPCYSLDTGSWKISFPSKIS